MRVHLATKLYVCGMVLFQRNASFAEGRASGSALHFIRQLPTKIRRLLDFRTAMQPDNSAVSQNASKSRGKTYLANLLGYRQ
jgi:hypothetical protein